MNYSSRNEVTQTTVEEKQECLSEVVCALSVLYAAGLGQIALPYVWEASLRTELNGSLRQNTTDSSLRYV